MSAAKSDVVVFLAHVFDAEIERRFFKLKLECSDCCDVVALVEQGSEVPPSIAPFTQFFDFSALKQMAKSVIGKKVVPGNCHLRSIDFYRRYPNYEFYWFIEYDVVYTGDWGRLIGSLTEDRSDLLAAHVRTLADNPRWYWNHSLATGSDNLSKDEWILAFLPIHRISARGLEAVARKVRDGWTGHFEALVPSALAYSGLRVSDLGGSGTWTPKDRIRRHYVDWRTLRRYGGSLQYRPSIRFRLIKNRLYHPCKTKAHPGKPIRLKGTILARLKAPRVFIPYWLRVMQLAVLSRLQ
jgi:hypothetical protein